VKFANHVGIGTLKYNIFSGPWLNEANVTYQRFRRNPRPNTPGISARIYQVPGGDYQLGSNLSAQDFIQKRLGLRDDITYTGLHSGGEHVLKAGFNVDFVKYSIEKRNDETPKFLYRELVDCHPTCGQNLPFNYRVPYQLSYGTGNPFLDANNTQLGLYLQDDWSPTPKLTFNLGLRWDFESHMMNYDYKTPQDVIDTLTAYNSQLPTPLSLSRYISTGSNRKPFYGAFQPRLGFSYALDRESRTTIFGGFGIFYDRTLFDAAVDETLKLTHPTYTIQFAHPDSTPAPGQVAWNDSYLTANKTTLDNLARTVGTPEAWLFDKNMKVPKSKQWNLGVRRTFGTMVASVTYQGQRGTDLLTLNWANFGLNPNGSCCTSFNIGAHGFTNFIYSTNDGKTWYDALSVQVDRPYRRSSENFGWGAGVVYTYAERSIAGVDQLGDEFAFPNTKGIPKHSDNGGNNEHHRVVANWIMDLPYLFGIQFGGLITLGSGAKRDVGCPSRFCGPSTYINGGFTPKKYSFIIPGAWAYRNVDLRFRKDFPQFSGTRLGVTLDVFNVFNFKNFGCYDTGFNSPTQGKSFCTVSDPRRAQIGAEYNF
jgi:outer membrane receptor protein involved in Fe transport